MKLCSVQFIKIVILSGLALAIIVPSVLCMHYAVRNFRLSHELMMMRAMLENRNAGKEVHLLLGDAAVSCNIDAISSPADEMDFTGFEYQLKYPDLYVERKDGFAEDVQKSVYLTFDDGPSDITSEVLRILREKNVKATFFVVYNSGEKAADLLREMIKDGHSASHVYSKIYSSVENFLEDFEKTSSWIENETGYRPEILRFPGGSVNFHNQTIYQPLIAEMLRRGYVYYDWNVSSGDAAKKTTPLSIANNTINGAAGKADKVIVLMHDGPGKRDTLRALPEIIDTLKESGRILLPLDNSVRPIAFNY